MSPDVRRRPFSMIAYLVVGLAAGIAGLPACDCGMGTVFDTDAGIDSGIASGKPDAAANPDAGAPTDAGAKDAGNPTDAGSTGDAGNTTSLWVLGYWANWQTTQYPLTNVKWSDMTHAALAFVLPRAPTTPTASNPYQTLDINNSAPSDMAAFSTAARGGGVKPLISLGGSGAGTGFAAAASSANRTQFISDILAACAQWNFDGVDLDWEDSINYADFQAFIQALRSAAPAGFVLTAPVGSVNTNFGVSSSDSALWSTVYPLMDQINAEDYTGTGDYCGWVVWYFDPLFGHGGDHPVDVASTMAAWNALGIPKSKLGIGIGFYGAAVGPPVTAALQSYGSAQHYEDDSTLSYGNIIRYFYGQGGAVYHWDSSAMAGWLSWPSGFTPTWTDQYTGVTPPTVQFFTYEDQAGIAAKGQWVKANGYGGTIIWTINEGTQFPYGSDGYQNPLLDAVKQAFLQ
jgi:chitinase